MVMQSPKACALVCLLMVMLQPLPLAAATLSATLERNPIHADETVQLVLSVDASWSSEEPDLAGLSREFEVLGTSTNTQLQLINGQQSASTRWLIELSPKRSGNLRINPIRVGQQHTDSLVLTVLPANSSRGGASANGQDIYLEAELSRTNPYVQSQLTYTLRLFRAVEILDGSLSEPAADNASIVRLGKDSSYTATNDGRTYRVIERRYAIFPQKSGELVIPPVFFNGQVADKSLGGSTFSRLFTRGKRIRTSTNTLKVTVLEKPAAFSGTHWLPANQLQIKESWLNGDPQFRVGEPITRTLRIEARGLNGAQLPEFVLQEDPQLKRYPDQPSTETLTDANWVYGVQEQRIALLPTKQGTIELPEVRMVWWDTEQDQERVAIVPARTFTVAPALTEVTAIATGAKAQPESRQSDPATVREVRIWQGISGTILAGWIVTAVAARRTRPRRPETTDGVEPDLRAAQRNLRHACDQNDATAARKALLDWGIAAWPQQPPKGLISLAVRLTNTELKDELVSLDRALYASPQQLWQGLKLREHLPNLVSNRRSSNKRTPYLPELYSR